MKSNGFKRYILIFGVLFLLDWILGAVQANRIIPTWFFLIFNFPFGILYVWMEYSWSGTSYLIFGYRVGDLGSLGIFLTVVLLQSYLYYWAYTRWLYKKHRKDSHPIS